MRGFGGEGEEERWGGVSVEEGKVHIKKLLS